MSTGVCVKLMGTVKNPLKTTAVGNEKSFQGEETCPRGKDRQGVIGM